MDTYSPRRFVPKGGYFSKSFKYREQVRWAGKLACTSEAGIGKILQTHPPHWQRSL
jgi:hypothetical protein